MTVRNEPAVTKSNVNISVRMFVVWCGVCTYTELPGSQHVFLRRPANDTAVVVGSNVTLECAAAAAGQSSRPPRLTWARHDRTATLPPDRHHVRLGTYHQ